MLKADAEAEKATIANLQPTYRCPVCNAATLLPCDRRPPNLALSQLFGNFRTYVELERIAEEEEKEWRETHDVPAPSKDGFKPPLRFPQMDLSAVAFGTRELRARALTRQILPKLRRAALQGRARISISDNVKELGELASAISRRLFRHGVHSVVFNCQHFAVFLLSPSRGLSTTTHVNPDDDERTE